MAQQNIIPNSPPIVWSTIDEAFQKINDNFTELYNTVESLGGPTIPTDISQLTDNQGLLVTTFDGGNAASEYNEEQTINGGGA
jgi:hypothetical protein